MRNSRQRGATLSLVVAITLVIIVVGLFIFFLTKILGGAQELQNAVDSGNLNVAKSALRSPDVKIFASAGALDLSGPNLIAARNNFSQLVDTSTGEIDLLVYNRLIGQAMLVSMNAVSDNYGTGQPPNPAGIANAKTLINLIANPTDGIGTILANKLKADQAMDDNFTHLAALFPMRMLNPTVGGSHSYVIGSDKDVSYMVPQTATNLVVTPNTIPVEFTAIDPGFVAANTVLKGTDTYFKGYNFFDIPSVTDNTSYPLMGVPLRPMEKPHLVSTAVFQDLKPTPLPGDVAQPAASRVPPNAFKSNGFSAELKSASAIRTLSCAIAGSVNVQGQYPVQIPCGFIVVANGAGVTPTGLPGSVTVDKNAAGLTADGYGGGAKDIFSDVLMYNTVHVANNGAMSENPSAIPDIQQWKADQAAKGLPQTPVPAALVNALDGPNPKQDYADGIDGSPASPCTNYTSAPGDSKSDARCVANLASMAKVYGTSVPGASSGTKMTGLMAIESEKAQVIDPRPSGGPAQVKGLNNTCTGMKAFNLNGITKTDPIQFGSAPTIGNLINSFKNYAPTAAGGSAIYGQLVNKLYQMSPNASASDIQAVLDTPMPMGAVRYIWLDTTGSLKITDASNLPTWINPNNIQPDGSPIVAETGPMPVDRTFVNMEGEQGFPSPWDCSGGPASMDNRAEWDRSSGFNCLQGVLRFQNCATDGGGDWRCPC